MKDRVDKAIAVIRGYCGKMTSCEKCRFYYPDEECPFNLRSPCDWEMDRKAEDERMNVK